MARAGDGSIQGEVAPVDMSGLSMGEKVAVASGLALCIFMLFPWYGVDLGYGTVNENAWSAFAFIDLLLFLVAAIAVAIPLARASEVLPANPTLPPAQLVTAAGALAVLLVLFRIVDLPVDRDAVIASGRKIGVFLGLLAATGIAFGGYSAMSEPRSRRVRRR